MPPKNPLSVSDLILTWGGEPINFMPQGFVTAGEANAETAPPKPKPLSLSTSFSCQMEMSKSLKKFLREETRTRPDQCHKRYYKWRLRKKWFNRYEKKRWLGRELLMDVKGMGQMGFRVTDVRFTKDGLEISSEPVQHEAR